MKFSESWLKDHLETDADTQRIAATLTAIGLELEGLEDPAEALAGFRVAKVLAARKHPDADRLQVLSIDAGGDLNGGEPLQVVCGAANARAGMVGVLGLPGAVVPANGMAMRKAAIRGVESNGMMCSARELGLGEDHEGIIELDGDAPVGAAYAEFAGLNDPVFAVAVTPNRPDCMGVYGIARDLAAAGLGTLKPIAAEPVPGSFQCPVEIRTDDPDGCPAFFGRVIRGVSNGESPAWMQARLRAAGQKPISALVDITNYVMLTYGRPSHAYDLRHLSGPVVARRAIAGEGVRALNGKDYLLDDTMVVIADDKGVHDIAGIMGGEGSGVTEGTSDVLLEVAFFDPERIARTGRALNLTSDARSRFERGVDPDFLEPGLAILTRLILDICGGGASEIVRAGAPPATDRTVGFDPALTAALGGIEIPRTEQRAILERLGFGITEMIAEAGDDRSAHWIVAVPGWRPDIDGAADLVEEIVRIKGLDAIVSVPLARHEGVARPTATAEQARERRARRAAAARGLHEAITWSFLPVEEAALFAGASAGAGAGASAGEGDPLWLLANPISEDMKAMRPSLLPGLLMAAQRNMARGESSVRLFEIGRRYLRGKDGESRERTTLGLVLAGEKAPRGWRSGKPRRFDAFDAKAEALALLDSVGAPVASLQVMDGAGEAFHPGHSATLRLGPNTVLARFGLLHPRVAQRFDVGEAVAAAEVHLDAIPARHGSREFTRPSYTPHALQSVTRDFAFLVPDGLSAGELLRAVRGADRAHIVDARLFDRFTGAGIPEGHGSLAIEVVLQPREASFTDDELKAISDAVIAVAAGKGAQLRG